MRKLLIFLTLVALPISLAAQDIILLRNADEIAAKVLEVDDESVLYKPYDNPNGPDRRIKIDRVLRITYANGHKEIFQPVTTRVGADGYPYPVVRNTYTVGDYFEEGEIKGVVLQVTDGGRHGLIVSLCETRECPFADTKLLKECNLQNEEIGCNDWKDGWKNRQRWEAYIAERGIPAECFPAMEWCRSLGPGWYLPSEEEVCMTLSVFTKDGNFPGLGSYQRAASELNDRFKAYGGDPFSYRGFISSTEEGAQKVYLLRDPRYKKKPFAIKKSSKTLNSVRAFHKF